jgi:DNA-binding LytR/AlgR family response regulator
MLRVMLVDDDQGNLQTLKLCLADFNKSIEIIGSFTSPLKAVAEIKRLNPDVLFLDIDMPVINGLSLAKETIGHYGELVFVTAHEKYWKDAFNIHAFEFLLKPIKDERLAKLVDDLKERETNGWLGLWQQRITDIENAGNAGLYKFDYIWLMSGHNGLDRVYWKDIVLLEKSKKSNEVIICTQKGFAYKKKNTTLAIVENDISKCVHVIVFFLFPSPLLVRDT